MTTASAYLTELVNYGGEIVTRGAMIADLNRVAATWTNDKAQQQRMVDMYLIANPCDCDATESCDACV